MKSNPLFVLCFCLSVGSLAVGQSVDDLGVGHPSSFQFEDSARDPLWPIGWSKQVLVSNVPGVPVVEVVPKPDAFRVTSISLDHIPLAIINGKAYGIGDRFVWTVPGEKGEPKTFRMQVVSIRDGVVTLRYGTVDLNCPLHILGNVPPSPAPK